MLICSQLLNCKNGKKEIERFSLKFKRLKLRSLLILDFGMINNILKVKTRNEKILEQKEISEMKNGETSI